MYLMGLRLIFLIILRFFFGFDLKRNNPKIIKIQFILVRYLSKPILLIQSLFFLSTYKYQ